MAETGTVIEKKGNLLTIEMKRRAECEHCGACLSFSNSDSMHLQAVNECHAAIGDTVEITLENNRFFTAVMFLYGIPLVAFLICFGICYALGTSELIGAAFSFGALAIAWLIVHFVMKKKEETRYLPKAIKVVTTGA